MFRVNNKCVSVLVALVCLSAPSSGRSWGGSHDYDHKWVAEPNDDQHNGPHHGWRDDFGSSEESWESKEDYQDYYPSHGYGKAKFDHFGIHHNHGGHDFDHHNHGNYEYHHHQGLNHQGLGHERHNSDNKQDYHGHHSRPESTEPYSSGFPQNNKGNAHNNLRPTPAQNTGSEPNLGLPQNSQNTDQFARNNADPIVFPDNETPNLITPRSPPVELSTTPAVTQPPSTSTTISPLVLQDILRCIRDCPATPEFNPVCGTNNVTYNNLGALECTRNCGVNVAIGRLAPCPQPLPPAFFISVPMLSTERPIVNARAGEDKGKALIVNSSADNAAQTTSPPENAAQTTSPPETVKPTRFTNI